MIQDGQEAVSITCGSVGGALAAYPHAKQVGRLVYLSGCSARQPDNSVLGVDVAPDGRILRCISKQTRGVIENMRAVLAEAGGSLASLVEVTVFLTSMEDYAAFNAVYNEYFDAATGPARTTVAVAALPGKDLLIEVKGIACL